MPLDQHDDNFSYKDIALMPLRGTILFTLIGLSVLLFMATLAGPLFGGWLYVISIIAMVRYAQIIISQTMRGYVEPPTLSARDFNFIGNFNALGFFGVLMLVAVLIEVTKLHLGTLTSTAFSALAVVALPAMFAATTLNQSLTSALNPVLIVRIIRVLGARYLGVAALVTAGYLGSGALADIIGWPFLSVLAGVYGLFLISCGVGRLLYASRAELDLKVVTRQDLIDRENHKYDYRQDSEALKVAAQTAPLSPIQAAQGLWAYHLRVSTSLERRWTSFNALRKWDNPSTALRFAQPFAAHLVRQTLLDQALDVTRWCFQTEPAFRLAEADTTFAVGHYALSLGQHQLAADILQDTGRRYPDHPSTVAALIKVGTLNAEKFNNPERVQDAVLQLRALGIAATDPRVTTLTRYLSEDASRCRH